MKTNRHLIQICLLAAVLLFPAAAQAQLIFTINNGVVTITGYTGNPTVMNIPSTTNGYPVTSIGNAAFLGCSSLSSVTIPDSVTNIGTDAFYGSSLINASIGNGVTNIAVNAFGSCINLNAITVGGFNSNYCSVAGVLFNRSTNTLIQFPGGEAGSYAVPSSVISIGGGAFSDCSGLTNVTIGNSAAILETVRSLTAPD
jgi:hypothetical protein